MMYLRVWGGKLARRGRTVEVVNLDVTVHQADGSDAFMMSYDVTTRRLERGARRALRDMLKSPYVAGYTLTKLVEPPAELRVIEPNDGALRPLGPYD